MAAALARAAQMVPWRFVSVGEARTDDELAYVEDVQRQGPDVTTVVNTSREDVRAWLARAKVFWHAAGLTESEADHPERLEHFGMATVEAMANGTVPVVIGRGGQPEIVEHGRSGFLCESLEDMVARTTALSADPELLARMSTAARERSRLFGRDAFDSRFRRFVPVLYGE
jgi:glycosyltransferase involved in cell wall biosynthesis